MVDRENFIIERVQEHYDEACSLGYEVVAVFLQGSQNYNLDIYDDEYQSDVDTKCIVLPTLDDIASGKAPHSSTHIRANNEHIDIKDIRVMFDMFKKQNMAYIELLFTDYLIINPKYRSLLNDLFMLSNAISRAHFNLALRCIAGTSLEKYKNLEHYFPNAADKIEKFGYDPKQLHHLLRIKDFVEKYIAGKHYKECLIPNDVEYLIKVKKGLYSLEDARAIAERTDREIKQLKDDNMQEIEHIDKETFNKLDNLKLKFIKQFLLEELKNE